MIGILGIKTDFHTPKFDLSSTSFELNTKELEILEGRRAFAVGENQDYIQSRNIQYLTEYQLLNRIFPHRVNTLGKVKQILHDGFRSF